MAVHPLRPATDRRLGGPLPHQPANQTRVHLVPPEFFTPYHAVLCAYAVLAVVSNCYPPVWGRLPTRYSPVRHSVNKNPSENFISFTSFDLHVLGTPPAFILSQDQTLMLKWCLCPASFIWHCLLLIRVACQSFDQLACSWISLKILEFSGLHYCLFVKDQNLLLRKSCVALLLFSAATLISYHNRFRLSTTFFEIFFVLENFVFRDRYLC